MTVCDMQIVFICSVDFSFVGSEKKISLPICIAEAEGDKFCNDNEKRTANLHCHKLACFLILKPTNFFGHNIRLHV